MFVVNKYKMFIAIRMITLILCFQFINYFKNDFRLYYNDIVVAVNNIIVFTNICVRSMGQAKKR